MSANATTEPGTGGLLSVFAASTDQWKVEPRDTMARIQRLIDHRAQIIAQTAGNQDSQQLRRRAHWELLDALEIEMLKLPQAEIETIHGFTAGLYSRTAKVPAGTVLISKIHNVEHQYVMSRGTLLVMTEEHDTPVVVSAGAIGVTKPGERRLVACLEDVVWTTFHPTEQMTLEGVEAEVYLKHDSHLLPAADEGAYEPGGHACLV